MKIARPQKIGALEADRIVEKYKAARQVFDDAVADIANHHRVSVGTIRKIATVRGLNK